MASDYLFGRFFEDMKPLPDANQAWMRCDRKDGGAQNRFLTTLGGPPPPPPPAADVVAAQAAGTLQLALPTVATAPPQGGLQLVGVDVWFWVTNDQPVTATATVPGLSATVSAAPVATHLAFGDGSRVDCVGAGTAYDPTRSGRSQSTDCRHAFEVRGDERVDVTVDWTLAWNASDGQAGSLPAVGRTTTIVLPVQEGRAVTD